MNNYLWTKSGARLKQFKPTNTFSTINNYNWVFIPAPGLGSESLQELVNILAPHIKSNIWLVDHPNDGSNLNPLFSYSNWRLALLEVASSLNNPILVSHSTGAMLLQSTCELEQFVKGLIWICSAPDMSWKSSFGTMLQDNLTKKMKDSLKAYTDNPSDQSLKIFIISMLKFSFNLDSLASGIEMVQNLPVNHKVADWSDQNFDPDYNAEFIPQHIPCLIINGELDQIIPSDIYKNNLNYYGKNILIRSIPQASHYPWFDNPKSIIQYVREFIETLGII